MKYSVYMKQFAKYPNGKLRQFYKYDKNMEEDEYILSQTYEGTHKNPTFMLKSEKNVIHLEFNSIEEAKRELDWYCDDRFYSDNLYSDPDNWIINKKDDVLMTAEAKKPMNNYDGFVYFNKYEIRESESKVKENNKDIISEKRYTINDMIESFKYGTNFESDGEYELPDWADDKYFPFYAWVNIMYKNKNNGKKAPIPSTVRESHLRDMKQLSDFYHNRISTKKGD